MPFAVSYSHTPDTWHIDVEWTITTAGAIVPNSDGTTCTEPTFTVARTAAGTYLLTIPGNYTRVIGAHATYRNPAGPTSVQAFVGAVGLGTGVATAGGGATTTFVITTGNSNAVPAAADQTTGVVGFSAVLRTTKP